MEPLAPMQRVDSDVHRAGRRSLLYLVAAFLLLLAAATMFFYERSQKIVPPGGSAFLGTTTPSRVALQQVLNLQYRGEYADSAKAAQRVIDSLPAGTTTLTYQRAITALATADFWSGEMEKRLEAVRLTKEQLAAVPGSPRNQAYLINRLIGYMTTAMEPTVIAEVFKGEPFQKLYDPRSDTDSIFKNLAEESLSRYPTSPAYARVGIWHAGKIFKHHDGLQKLSRADLEVHIEGIRTTLSSMDSLLGSELKQDILYKQLTEAQFRYYGGFLYGALALVRPEYLAQAESAFAAVRSEYEQERSASGDKLSLIESRLMYTDFSLATFLNATGGSARREDVQRYLQEMIDLMTAHPDVHKGAFLAFMHQTLLDGPEKTADRWYSYGRFVQMAELYAPFKEFLNKNGWELR